MVEYGDQIRLHSSVVERHTCNMDVGGSNPPVGLFDRMAERRGDGLQIHIRGFKSPSDFKE